MARPKTVKQNYSEIATMLDHLPKPTLHDINKVKIAALTCKSVEEFASFMEVDPVVFKAWTEQSVPFKRAYLSWRDHMSSKVEVAMAKRAVGFTKTTKKDIITRAGNVVTLETETYYPPSEAAAQFWLKNREPEDWKDKSEVDINVTANIRAWLIEAGSDVDLIDVTPTPQLEASTEIVLLEQEENEFKNDLDKNGESSLNEFNNNLNGDGGNPLIINSEQPLNTVNEAAGATPAKKDAPLKPAASVQPRWSAFNARWTPDAKG